MTYVLIVLSAAHYGWNAAAIPGYRSEQSCIEAGKQWLDKMPPKEFARTYQTGISYRYVCLSGPNPYEQPKDK